MASLGRQTLLEGLQSWSKMLQKTGVWKTRAEVNIDGEWDAYYNSYCKCKDSLAWKRLDGSDCGECTQTSSNDVIQAAQAAVVSKPEVAYVLCIDEGVQDLYATKSNITLCVPGCGILMRNRKDDLAKEIATLAQEQKLSKIIVTSHVDCGAAALATNEEFEQIKHLHSQAFLKNLTEIVAVDYATTIAAMLKEELKNSGIIVEPMHISKLDRPKFHHAFGAVVNFVPNFNIGIFEKKLNIPMFGISAHLLDNETARRDVTLAYQIASGKHGFVNKFSEDQPFEAVAIVASKEDIDRAEAIFSHMPKTLPINYTFVSVNK